MSNTAKQGEDARALSAAATSLLARTLKLHVRFDSAATQFHSFIPAMAVQIPTRSLLRVVKSVDNLGICQRLDKV